MQHAKYVVVTLALAAAACGKKASASKDAPPEPTISVPVTAAVMLPTPEPLILTGTVTPDESSDVAADIGGKVVAVLVERGDIVKQGAPLVRLDTRSAQLGAREANANLEAARAQKQLAQDECARAQALYDKAAITKAEYEREQTSCTSALQQVTAAEARTQMITKSIRDGIVLAPFAGTISDRWIAPGEWVSPGMRLVTLVDSDPLKVELTVPESEVPKIKAGQDVLVKAVAWDTTFPAKITRIGAEIGRQSRALIVEATIAPGTPLVSGMFVEAAITVDTRPHVAIPDTAIKHKNRTDRVFVVVDGHLIERVIQKGAAPAPGMVSVLKGLAEGDQVVTTAADDKVIDGIKLAGAPAPAPAPAPAAPAPTAAKK